MCEYSENTKINLCLDNYYNNPYRLNIKNINLIENNYVSNDLNNINEFDKNNKDFDPLLFKIIANNKMTELKKILNNNKLININIQDKDGDTPLHISVFLSNFNAIKILL